VEQLPIVLGKLQMAYEPFPVLNTEDSKYLNFHLLSLCPFLLENTGKPDTKAWAFSHAQIEYLTQNLTIE
jgi:hypothetical protein